MSNSRLGNLSLSDMIIFINFILLIYASYQAFLRTVSSREMRVWARGEVLGNVERVWKPRELKHGGCLTWWQKTQEEEIRRLPVTEGLLGKEK